MVEAINEGMLKFVNRKTNISKIYIKQFHNDFAQLVEANYPPLKEKGYNYTLPPFILRLTK